MSGSAGWGAAGDPFDVVLIGDAGEMAEAVALAGGRVVARLAPDDAFTATDALVAVDLSDAADDALDGLTARADIVTCGLDQLDAVAAAMLWSDAQLLCAPSMADRVAALALAGARARDPEGVRETDGARLRRFGIEVGRIAQTLARLAETEGGAIGEHHRPWDAGPASLPAGVDAAAVRQTIRARRLRATHFGEGLFEDPAWDMLLDLFAAELEGGRVSVSSLCIASNVAPTTALRWITRLTDAGLFERRPDPADRRRAFIALSAQGAAAMRGYVAALARAGMGLG